MTLRPRPESDNLFWTREKNKQVSKGISIKRNQFTYQQYLEVLKTEKSRSVTLLRKSSILVQKTYREIFSKYKFNKNSIKIFKYKFINVCCNKHLLLGSM